MNVEKALTEFLNGEWDKECFAKYLKKQLRKQYQRGFNDGLQLIVITINDIARKVNRGD